MLNCFWCLRAFTALITRKISARYVFLIRSCRDHLILDRCQSTFRFWKKDRWISSVKCPAMPILAQFLDGWRFSRMMFRSQVQRRNALIFPGESFIERMSHSTVRRSLSCSLLMFDTDAMWSALLITFLDGEVVFRRAFHGGSFCVSVSRFFVFRPMLFSSHTVMAPA
ncbi:uncharacterized protein LOC123684172 [Harmonia axyridis]|uniref:uncharacterized protein LOC123684172 n=1 Tax=Harmonia axyridis TaxID=115357 RepID=UPI001E274F52|nr:uncharacterized protein LOC123684172 [Harmonia axyridis]